MTPDQFTYWLQGHVELLDSDKPPTKKQWKIIKDHLKLVFDKQTPDRTNWPINPLPELPNPFGPPYEVTCGPGLTIPNGATLIC